MIRLSARFALLASLLIPSWGWAQAAEVSDAFQRAPLSACGSPGKILSMEKTPSRSATSRYVTEVEATIDQRTWRVPIVLERTKEKRWRVVWSPDQSFCSAASNMIKGGVLPVADGSSYTKARRIPTMPIVVTEKRIVSPFGVVTESEAEGITLNEDLAKHTQQWVRDVYGNDPAPAAFDLIVAPDLSWERFNTVIFSVSSIGLYLINVLTLASDGSIATVGVAAPVSTLVSAERPAKGTIAVYTIDGKIGVRVVSNGTIQTSETTCREGMTFCAETPTAFASQTVTFFPALKPSDFFLLAATNRQTVQSMISLVGPLQAAVKLPPHHVLLGYIQGAK